MKAPEISLVMSVYNQEPYVGQAIESILNQTFEDFECIVVDDASTDRTPQILGTFAARDSRIVLVRNEENRGLARSLNRGLGMARGRYVARQDADDWSMPERFVSQVAFFADHPTVGLLGTAYALVDEEGRSLAIHRQPCTDTEIRWQILFHNPFCHSSVMFRRELILGIGRPFREDLHCSQDYELWTRLMERTSGANLAVPLVAFRIHRGSTSATRSEEQQRLACEIAACQIRKMAPEIPLTMERVSTLRRWYYAMPKRMSGEDVDLCFTILEIFKRFERREGLDPFLVGRIRRDWVDRVLSAFPIGQMGPLWRSGLLGPLHRLDKGASLLHWPKRAARTLQKAFTGRP